MEDEHRLMVHMLQRAVRESYSYVRLARREGAVWGFEQFVRSRKDDYSEKDYAAACCEHGEALSEQLESKYYQVRAGADEDEEEFFLHDVASESMQSLRDRLGNSQRDFSNIQMHDGFY